MNLNELAVKIASLEGKKKETDIAQIKEVLSVTFKELKKLPKQELFKTLGKCLK